MQAPPLSLLELNQHLKEVIKNNTRKHYWTFGEISELKVNYSGHCYLELIQKDNNTDKIVARSRATMWAQAFRMIKPYFETTTGQPLTEGLQIMVKVSVEFHEAYGLSLNITDIEPSYTVGELALKKQKIIERLINEGVIDMNKQVPLPDPCKKIAVISSATAAGYEDFINQLTRNEAGFKFYVKLFPAVMQGNEAESSIIAALDKIYTCESLFDCVVIIRGGGSQADLSCFNNYWLAYHITQFPLPVFTGIGHEQDDSVVDTVAHTRLKTPTAVAAFLLGLMSQHMEDINTLSENIIAATQVLITGEITALTIMTKNFQLSLKNNVITFSALLTKIERSLSDKIRRNTHQMELTLVRSRLKLEINSKGMIRSERIAVKTNGNSVRRSASHTILNCRQTIDRIARQIDALDPVRVLYRGYSITCKDGKILKDVAGVNPGDMLETKLYKGKLQTTVKTKSE
jgi:exodeoxyribonuclease VII large subunit